MGETRPAIDRLGEFELLQRLGAGAQAEVFLAATRDGQLIALKVMLEHLTVRDESRATFMREALELVTAESRVTIHLHPQDCELLGTRASSLAERMSGLGACSLVPDPEIEPGGCRVDTEFGCIDYQIRAQLARIEEELAG